MLKIRTILFTWRNDGFNGSSVSSFFRVHFLLPLRSVEIREETLVFCETSRCRIVERESDQNEDHQLHALPWYSLLVSVTLTPGQEMLRVRLLFASDKRINAS